MSASNNYPKGKDIERELCSKFGGSSKLSILIDRVAWENVSDELPSYIYKRGKGAALSWLYKLVRENFHDDGRKRCAHRETLEILYREIIEPEYTSTPVTEFVRHLAQRQRSRAGRKAGLKSGEIRKI